MIKLILGAADSGNSQELIRRMVELAAANPSKQYIAIVPEQATMTMQRRVVELHPDHAAMNIDIVSFERLAHKVFAEQGRSVKNVLDDTGKLLILRKVLDDCKDDMIVYQNKVNSLGFIEEMKSVVTELKQYSIDDNELFLMQESAVENNNKLLNAKLQDIRLIYRRFNEEIIEKYTTSEEVLDIFARLVPASKMIKEAELYFDGFTGFTPIQYRLLEEMGRCSRGLNISFTLPREKEDEACPDYDLFYLSNRTLLRIRDIAVKTQNDFDVEYVEKAEDASEEQRFAGTFAASTIENEVTFIAKEILHLVRKENYRFRDIAIVTSDMESYHKVIKNVFAEAGIPSFIDYKSELSDNPLARFVISALQLGSNRMSYESVFSLLKTDMTGIDRDKINMLENYCLEFGIKGFKAWSNDFVKNIRDKWNLDSINSIRSEIMSMIASFYGTICKGEVRALEYSEALKKLLDNISAEEMLHRMSQYFYEQQDASKGKEYEQIFNLVIDLLDKISVIMGDETLSVQEYQDLLISGLAEIKVGIIPPTLDAVTAGDLTRTRLSEIKALFLIGVNDGKIPMVKSGSGLFTQKEREFLKEKNFEIAPTVLENLYTQRFYLHLLFTKPSERFYLTYPSFGMGGESLSPSFILGELKELGVESELEIISGPKDEKWKKDLFSELASTIEDADETLLKYAAEKEPDQLKQIISGHFFTNRDLKIDEQVALDLYGEKLQGSVSRFERFFECPFKHFMDYGMRIKPRPEYEIKAADIGNIYHASIEYYSKELESEGLTFNDVSDEDSHRIIKECVAKASAEMESGMLEDSSRNEFLVQRIEAVAEKTTDVLREHVKAGLFEPKHFEFQFEPEEAEGVSFGGKIDRVDIYEGDDVYVKIIDYKTGNKEFKIKDIYTGKQLQLVAYMKQAIKKVQKDYPDKTVRPGGIYYYVINDKYVKTEKENAEKFRMSGLTNCEPEVMKAIDKNLEDSGKKSSQIIEAKKIANNNEFDQLIAFVDNKIKDVSQVIKQGEACISPSYENENNNACAYCDFKTVCKFESGKFGTKWNELPEEIDTAVIEHELYGRVIDVKE